METKIKLFLGPPQAVESALQALHPGRVVTIKDFFKAGKEPGAAGAAWFFHQAAAGGKRPPRALHQVLDLLPGDALATSLVRLGHAAAAAGVTTLDIGTVRPELAKGFDVGDVFIVRGDLKVVPLSAHLAVAADADAGEALKMVGLEWVDAL